MAHLTTTQVKGLCDKLQAQIDLEFNTCGSWEFESGTVMGKTNTAINYGTTNWTAGEFSFLLKHLQRMYHHMSYERFALLAQQFLRALDDHLRRWEESGINAFLGMDDERVGYWLLKSKFPLDPVIVFPPGWVDSPEDDGVTHGATWNDGITKMGKAECTSGGGPTWNFTAGDDIDVTKYGKSNLILYCDNGFSAAPHVFTVTCKKWDETTEAKTCAINMATGSYSDIGIHDTHMYIGVTNIAYFSGTSATGDIVTCMSEVERVPTL